jgi:cytochrome P450
MPLNQIISEFMTFYVAGMDTTGHLSGMAVWYLTQYKNVKDTL